MFSNFFIISEGWRSKHIQNLSGHDLAAARSRYVPVLRQNQDAHRKRQSRCRCSRIKQYHANHRILVANGTITTAKDWETFCFQRFDGFNHRWVTRQHVCRDFRQADAFSNNAVFHDVRKLRTTPEHVLRCGYCQRTYR